MLSSDDRVILDFERGWWLEAGPKDQAIEFALGMTALDYYRRLRRLAFDPLAFAYDPLTIKRVRALIETGTHRELAV